MMTLTAMFFAAFIAATLIAAQSEAVLVGMLLADSNPVWLLLLVATTGNVFGSLVNWVIGRFLQGYAVHRWFPASPGQVARARLGYAQHGWWTLLGSWLPVYRRPFGACVRPDARTAVARGAGRNAGERAALPRSDLHHLAVCLTLTRRVAPTG